MPAKKKRGAGTLGRGASGGALVKLSAVKKALKSVEHKVAKAAHKVNRVAKKTNLLSTAASAYGAYTANPAASALGATLRSRGYGLLRPVGGRRKRVMKR